MLLKCEDILSFSSVSIFLEVNYLLTQFIKEILRVNEGFKTKAEFVQNRIIKKTHENEVTTS